MDRQVARLADERSRRLLDEISSVKPSDPNYDLHMHTRIADLAVRIERNMLAVAGMAKMMKWTGTGSLGNVGLRASGRSGLGWRTHV